MGRQRAAWRGAPAGSGGNASRRVSNPQPASPGVPLVTDLRGRPSPGDAWDADACGVAGNEAGLVERHTRHER